MKLKKKIYCWACVLLAVLFASYSANAQDAKAEAILNEVSEQAKSYKTIEAEFTSLLEDKSIDLTATQSGSILIEGEKFKLNLDEKYLILSDGTTLWNYGMDTGECMVENVADVIEDQGIQPSDLFKIWEKDFKKYYDKEAKVGTKLCDVIKLIPVDPKDKPFHTVKVFIEKETKQIAQAIIFGKEGNNTTYTIKSFKTNVTVGAGDFTFNQSDYPGVEVIDNR